MRRRTFVAWVALVVALLAVGVYVGLLVQRRVSPPVVAVPAGNALPGFHRGDAALLRNIDGAQIRAGDILAARVRGAVVIGRVGTAEREPGSQSVSLDGATRSGSLEVKTAQVIGRVDRRVPLAGWFLVAAQHHVVQLVIGLGLLALIVLLVTGRGTPLDYLDDHPPMALGGPEPLALPAGPAAWPAWVTGDAPPPDWVTTETLPEPGGWPAWVTGEGPPPRWAIDGDKPAGIVAMTPGLLMPYVEHSMSITPDDLRQVRFAQARKGGYDTEAVDRALDTVADSIDVMLQERAQLVERLHALETEVERYKAIESQLGQSLATAERSAQQVKADAQLEAQRILGEAKAAAGNLPAVQSGAQDSTMVELLGETRAIRSLLQAILTQGGEPSGPPPASA